MAVVHETDLDWVESTHDERFGHRRKQLGGAAGGQGLGCSLLELAPGQRGWPFHWHAHNEEAIYVLEGEGTLRYGEDRLEVRAGSYPDSGKVGVFVGSPPGRSEGRRLSAFFEEGAKVPYYKGE